MFWQELELYDVEWLYSTELRTTKDVKGTHCGHISGIVQAFSRKDWRKP